jgi:hypothetical protein
LIKGVYDSLFHIEQNSASVFSFLGHSITSRSGTTGSTSCTPTGAMIRCSGQAKFIVFSLQHVGVRCHVLRFTMWHDALSRGMLVINVLRGSVKKFWNCGSSTGKSSSRSSCGLQE